MRKVLLLISKSCWWIIILKGFRRWFCKVPIDPVWVMETLPNTHLPPCWGINPPFYLRNYSTYLNSYMSRIDEKIQNECPDCKESPHDTQHLFNCTEKPTILTTYSLWTQPREAALHLGLEVEEEEVTWPNLWATTTTTILPACMGINPPLSHWCE